MKLRKNKKRINPRYFLHETIPEEEREEKRVNKTNEDTKTKSERASQEEGNK